MKILYALSCWREREGVRVDICLSPHLYPLPTGGEESATGYFYKSLHLTLRVLDNNR
jgi:hypothetical protein